MNSPVLQADHCTANDIADSDLVILGTSVYIGKLQLKEWISENSTMLVNNQVFMFVVSGTAPNERQKLTSYVRSSITGEIANQWHIYFLPGRLIYKRLSRMDKFMLKMGAFLTKDPKTKKQMLADYDEVKKENLDGMLSDIRLISETGAEIKNAS